MENIVIIGSSGHAKVVIDIVQKEKKFNIVGLIDRFRDVSKETLGYPILGKEEDLPHLINVHNLQGVIVAIGDNFVRSRVVARIQELSPNISFVSAIHPDASVATDVTIGNGTVVMSGVSIGPSSSIGNFCILNTNCSLDHDSKLANFASLAPGVNTGGNCQIDQYSAISIGSILIHGISIGEHTVIGAGSMVIKSIDPFVVAYGTPAKSIRDRKPGEKYL